MFKNIHEQKYKGDLTKRTALNRRYFDQSSGRGMYLSMNIKYT